MLKSRKIRIVLVGMLIAMLFICSVPVYGFDIPAQQISGNDTNNTTNDTSNNTVNNTQNIQPIGAVNNTVAPAKTNNTSNYTNQNLPKTGVTDVYFVAILVAICTIAAIYAYKKVRDYQSIR